MGNKLYRSAEIDLRSVNDESRTVSLAFSSEEPYERMFGYEVLDHAEGSVNLERLNNGGALLLDHDPTKQIGVIEKAFIGEDRRGRALVRFSRSQLAEEVYQDVKDGIRRNVSVGYWVDDMVREEEKMDGIDVWRATKWTPVESSIVSIPADITVGINRDAEREFNVRQFEKPIKNETEKKSMENENNTTPIPAPAPDNSVEIKRASEKAANEEKARIREINAIAKKFKLEKDGEEFIESGKPVDAFRMYVMEKLGDAKPIDPKANDIGMSEKETGEYSIVRAIRGLLSGDMKATAPLEYAASMALAKKIGKDPQGFFLPEEVKRRDLTVGTSTAGGNLVATDLLSGSFIELLRNRLVIRQLGARFLSGLQGNVAIPRQTGGATAYWVTEGNAPTESQLTVDQVTMSPSTVGAFTDISRKLIIQSSLDIENLVKTDLATVLALEIDRAAINGSGSGAEPTGILNTSGIGNVGTSPAAPTYANIIALWNAVALENADIGNLAFLASPGGCSKLMQIFTNATYGQLPVWQGGPGDGSMLGYKAMVSNQVPANLGSSTGATTGDMTLSAIIFGNWSDLIVGEWSGTDILVDPYTASTTGTVRIVVLQDVDVAIRHAASFAAMKEVDVS